MLFMTGLAFGGDIAAKTLHLLFGLMGGVGLFFAGKRWRSSTVGALAATLFLVGPGGVGPLLGNAYVEGLTACAMIAGAVAWLAWFRSRHLGWLRCAGVLAGVGASFKITAALFPMAMVALTLVALRDKSRQEPAVARPSLGALCVPLVLVLVPVAPWLARSALLTGNPVFPMFAKWIPSRDMSPALSAAYDKFNRLNTWGTGIGSRWSVARRELILAIAAGCLMFLAGAIFARTRRFMGRGTVAVVAVTALVQMMAAGLYVRYWVPLLSVLQLPIAALLEGALPSRWRQHAVILLTAATSLMMARRGLGSVENDLGGLVRTAAGLESHQAFRERHLLLLPLYERANEDLPGDARILLSCSCSGFYLDRSTVCGEFPQDAVRYTRWDEFVSDLRALHVTHVVAPRTLATGGPPPEDEVSSSAMIRRHTEYDLVGRLLRSHGRLLAAAADQGLYTLDVGALR
jgi:hypothetical protein